jgi:ABC-2 type transport system ATP-binding protein
MQKMYKKIVDFAELERFMDQRLKNYSSGMQVRLAFSISINVKSDILLFDEVLAVGDAAFQQKCYDYFESLQGKDTTVILVTHDMTYVKHFCERTMLINDGEVVMTGSSDEAARKYLSLNKAKPS